MQEWACISGPAAEMTAFNLGPHEGIACTSIGPDDHVQSRFELRCSTEAEAIELANNSLNWHDVGTRATGTKDHTFNRRVDYSDGAR